MSLIKETGSGVTGANTYVTADDVAIYCSNRGLTEWADSTNATAKDQAIISWFKGLFGLRASVIA